MLHLSSTNVFPFLTYLRDNFLSAHQRKIRHNAINTFYFYPPGFFKRSQLQLFSRLKSFEDSGDLLGGCGKQTSQKDFPNEQIPIS